MEMGFNILEQAALKTRGNNSQNIYPPSEQKQGNSILLGAI
jgi:hypothetical protein